VDGNDLGRVELQEGTVILQEVIDLTEGHTEPEGEQVLDTRACDERSGSQDSEVDLLSDSEDSTFSNFNCLPLPRTTSEDFSEIFNTSSDELECEF